MLVFLPKSERLHVNRLSHPVSPTFKLIFKISTKMQITSTPSSKYDYVPYFCLEETLNLQFLRVSQIKAPAVFICRLHGSRDPTVRQPQYEETAEKAAIAAVLCSSDTETDFWI